MALGLGLALVRWDVYNYSGIKRGQVVLNQHIMIMRDWPEVPTLTYIELVLTCSYSLSACGSARLRLSPGHYGLKAAWLQGGPVDPPDSDGV